MRRYWLLTLMLALGGCGQSGALYLPADPPPQRPGDATPPAQDGGTTQLPTDSDDDEDTAAG